MKDWALRAATAVVLGLASAGSCLSADLWVAPGGAGDGRPERPFGTIAAALEVAASGDVVRIRDGEYLESLATTRDGAAGAPITVRAERRSAVVVTWRGTVLAVGHAHHVFEGLVLDGQYGGAPGVRVGARATGLVMRAVEVRRSGRDCIDIAATRDVLVEGALVHHCLDASGGRRDAHGIVAGAVRNLTIRDTEVHTFSGDGVQVDPGRASPGWNEVTIEGCHFWLAPLPADAAGFRAGAVTGENAVDTKTIVGGERARLTIRDTTARGFRGAIRNQAAFNLKEHVEAVVDRVSVSDSEIAFRVRGPGTRGAGGVWLRLTNAVVYGVDVAVRIEDAVEQLRIWSSTFGLGVGRAFLPAGVKTTGVDVQNVLVVNDRLEEPAAPGGHNLAVEPAAFVDAAGGDYHLAPGARAIDAGMALPDVQYDRDGRRRPQGKAWDVGAYEAPAGSEPR